MAPKDAYEAILSDLQKTQTSRRKHFLPALSVIAIMVIGFFVVMRTRPDLLEQPIGMLVLQCALWVLCLLVMPAIGVGLLFPGRRTRLMIALAAIVCAVAATTGWPVTPHVPHGGEGGFDRCLTVVLGAGVLLLGLGFLSGAFIQRRRMSSVFWVAAGLTLAALNVITWHCPQSGLMHVLPSHVGGAVMLLGVAVVAGIAIHRRGRAEITGDADGTPPAA